MNYSVMFLEKNEYEVTELSTGDFAIISVPESINRIDLVSCIIDELNTKPRYLEETLKEIY